MKLENVMPAAAILKKAIKYSPVALLVGAVKDRKTNQDDYEPAMKDSGTGRVSVENAGLNGKVPEGIVRGSGSNA